MYATMSPNPFKRCGLPILCFTSLLIAVLAQPVLSFPLALLIPLIICPAQASTGLWFALLIPIIPFAGLLQAGEDLLISLSMLPFSYLCLIVSQMAQKHKFNLISAAICYTAVILFSFALLLARLTHLLGSDLFHGLAKSLTASLAAHPARNETLYLLLRTGVLQLPTEMESAASILLGKGILMLPWVRAELLNGLQFQLFTIFRQVIPTLLIQASLTLGLFIALQTARENMRQSPKRVLLIYPNGTGALTSGDAVLPSFRSLYLPPAYQLHALVLAILALLLFCYGSGEIASLISTMLMTAVTTTYSLLGAAVLVFLLCRNHPRRTAPAGFAAAALYLLFPTVLFVLGLCDQFLHLRIPPLQHEED